MREILWHDNGTTRLTLKVDALVDGNSVHTVLDTAAQASVLSWSWVEKNDISISDGVNVLLKGPTPDVTFQATLVKQVSIQLGRTVRFCDLYVANISDDMLLGLDILKLFRLSIDLANDVVILPDEELVASVCRLGQSETNSANRVRLVKNTNIHPRTRITCVTKLEHEVNGDVVIRGLRHPSGLLMPNYLVLADTDKCSSIQLRQRVCLIESR